MLKTLRTFVSSSSVQPEPVPCPALAATISFLSLCCPRFPALPAVGWVFDLNGSLHLCPVYLSVAWRRVMCCAHYHSLLQHNSCSPHWCGADGHSCTALQPPTSAQARHSLQWCLHPCWLFWTLRLDFGTEFDNSGCQVKISIPLQISC